MTSMSASTFDKVISLTSAQSEIQDVVKGLLLVRDNIDKLTVPQLYNLIDNLVLLKSHDRVCVCMALGVLTNMCSSSNNNNNVNAHYCSEYIQQQRHWSLHLESLLSHQSVRVKKHCVELLAQLAQCHQVWPSFDADTLALLIRLIDSSLPVQTLTAINAMLVLVRPQDGNDADVSVYRKRRVQCVANGARDRLVAVLQRAETDQLFQVALEALFYLLLDGTVLSKDSISKNIILSSDHLPSPGRRYSTPSLSSEPGAVLFREDAAGLHDDLLALLSSDRPWVVQGAIDTIRFLLDSKGHPMAVQLRSAGVVEKSICYLERSLDSSEDQFVRTATCEMLAELFELDKESVNSLRCEALMMCLGSESISEATPAASALTTAAECDRSMQQYIERLLLVKPSHPIGMVGHQKLSLTLQINIGAQNRVTEQCSALASKGHSLPIILQQMNIMWYRCGNLVSESQVLLESAVLSEEASQTRAHAKRMEGEHRQQLLNLDFMYEKSRQEMLLKEEKRFHEAQTEMRTKLERERAKSISQSERMAKDARVASEQQHRIRKEEAKLALESQIEMAKVEESHVLEVAQLRHHIEQLSKQLKKSEALVETKKEQIRSQLDLIAQLNQST